MKQDAPESGAEAEDRIVRDMRVERVERADGRYLVYYAWPDAPVDPGTGSAADDPGRGEQDV